jgi:hypothetical protein
MEAQIFEVSEIQRLRLYRMQKSDILTFFRGASHARLGALWPDSSK